MQGQFFAQSIQSARLFVQSSELGPPLLTRKRVLLPPPLGQRGETHLLQGPNSDEGNTLWYSMYTIISYGFFRDLCFFYENSRDNCSCNIQLSFITIFYLWTLSIIRETYPHLFEDGRRLNAMACLSVKRWVDIYVGLL